MASIRWLIRRDMPEVLAIETSSFETPGVKTTSFGAFVNETALEWSQRSTTP